MNYLYKMYFLLTHGTKASTLRGNFTSPLMFKRRYYAPQFRSTIRVNRGLKIFDILFLSAAFLALFL